MKLDNFEKCVSEPLRRLHGPCKWYQRYIFTWKLPCEPVLRPRSDMGMPCKGTCKPGAPDPYTGIPCKGACKPGLTWEFHVIESSKRRKPPPPLRHTWESHVSRDQKVRIYMGLHVNIARFCSRPSPHGIPMWNSSHFTIHIVFPCGRACSCGL